MSDIGGGVDMNDAYIGAGAAPLLRGAGGVTFWPPEDDEVVHPTTIMEAPVAGCFLRGFVGSGGSNMLPPSKAAVVTEAALAASYCSTPPENVHRSSCQERHYPQQQQQPQEQPQRHSVYAHPPTGSCSADRDWGCRPHRGSWQAAIAQGIEGGRREERVETARGDGVGVGGAGARDDHGGGGGGGVGDVVPAKKQTKMHALEQELMERAQGSSKRMRTAATATTITITTTTTTTTTATAGGPSPTVVTAYGMVFPPPSRELSRLLRQDGRETDETIESISTNPGTLAGIPVHGTTHDPITAVRRRRVSTSPQAEQKPLFPVTTQGQRFHDLGKKELFFGTGQEPACSRARAAMAPAIPGTIGRRNLGKRCQHPGCSRGSTFGEKGGARKATHCATHKRDDMAKITSRQCAGDACSTAPSYGFQGKRASFCSKHKMPGMVNVVTPRCQRDDCGSCASYGHAAERRPLFCARHAQDGMTNVVSRKCLGVGCIKNPSYGHPGDRRASFCVDHQLDGMSNIVSPKCLGSGCGKAPSFGNSGDRKATWCKAHKEEGMVNLLYSRQLKRMG